MTDASPDMHPALHWANKWLNSPAGLAIIASTIAAVVLSLIQHWVFAPMDRADQAETASFQDFRVQTSEFETLIGELGVHINDQADSGNFDEIEIGELRGKLFDNMSKQDTALSSIALWADEPIKSDSANYRKSLADLHEIIAVLHDHNDMKAIADTAGAAVKQKRAIEAKLNKQLY